MQNMPEQIRFPKEFKKNYIQSTDWKFLALVLASLLLHGLSILYLIHHFPANHKNPSLKNARFKFAQRIFNDIRSERANIDRLRQFQDQQAHLYRPNHQSFSPVQFVHLKQNLPDLHQNVEVKIDEKSRRKYKLQRIKNVSDIGLLGIVNTVNKARKRELQNFYAALDKSSMQIAEKLEEFSRFESPRSGIEYTTEIKPANALQFYSEKSYRRRKNPRITGGKQQFPPQESIEHFKKLLQKHNPAIQEIYRRFLEKKPELSGKLSIRFGLNISGKVTFASIVQSSTGSSKFDEKILANIRQWDDFGEIPAERKEIILRHTYVFE